MLGADGGAVCRARSFGACRLDPANPALKYHQVEQIGSKWRESREVDMEALPQVPQETSAQV